jgi:hypothetical protein
MKRYFKLLLPGLLLGAWAVAIAQAPPGEERADGADAGEPALPCVFSGVAILPSGVHGPPEPGAVPCEEHEPEETPGEEQVTGAEVTADEVFTPGDEINEDYPVPLPADM